jgi:hypothetical protein
MNLFKRRPCAGCLAKEQTIALLADLVDWHRGREGLTMQSATQTVAPPLDPNAPAAQWASDDEEVIAAALDYGAIDAASAERLMAHMQAQNTTLTAVK